MITVRCELNDNNLYSLLDDEFVNNAGMNKVSQGHYEGVGNIINTSFFAIKKVLKNNNIVNNIKSFTRDVDGEEEDLIEFYSYLKSKGRI